MSSRIGDHVPPISLLKDAGFEHGDFLPLYTINPNAAWRVTSTSTTYTQTTDLGWLQCAWNDLIPWPDVNPLIYGLGRVMPGSGETVDVRIRNTTDGETVGSAVTGITADTMVKVGPVDYEPTTKDARIDIYWQYRTDPGTNALDLREPFIIVGVEL